MIELVNKLKSEIEQDPEIQGTIKLVQQESVEFSDGQKFKRDKEIEVPINGGISDLGLAILRNVDVVLDAALETANSD